MPAAPLDPELLRLVEGEYPPHHRALGTHLIHCAVGEATLSLPWREDLVGNPETGSILGAVLASVLDHAAGLSVIARIGKSVVGAAATLAMHVDYIRPSARGRAVNLRADCYAVRGELAFVRGTAWHPDGPEGDLLSAAITYILTGPPPRQEGKS
jgi:uncharacterized protein (TIGR00369 family)